MGSVAYIDRGREKSFDCTVESPQRYGNIPAFLQVQKNASYSPATGKKIKDLLPVLFDFNFSLPPADRHV